MKTNMKIASLGALLLLGGCVSMPSGPSVMALPGSSRSFEQFRGDDFECRQFANNQVGGETPACTGDSAVRAPWLARQSVRWPEPSSAAAERRGGRGPPDAGGESQARSGNASGGLQHRSHRLYAGMY